MIFTIEDLKKKPVWVNWILFDNPDRDKPTKPLKNPKNGWAAKVNDPTTWGTYEIALSKVGSTITHRHYKGKDMFTEYPNQIIAGVGFNFSDDIAGIDIDNKQGDPELDKQAETILALFADTYAERSPSGTGWHIIFRYDKTKMPTDYDKYYMNNQKTGLECYFPGHTKKYFTYTGQGNGKNIEDMTEQVLIFLDSYMLKSDFQAKNDRQERTGASQSYQTSTDILEKARKAKNGLKFIALFDRGDISGYKSHSEADQALCNILAWWLQGDFSEIDSYFKQSALYRADKWERNDYKSDTIDKAIDSCGGEYYRPPGRPKKEKVKKEYTPEQEKIIKNAQDRFGTYDDNEITIAGVAFYLEQIGISVEYNETTRSTVITGLDRYNNNYIVDSFPIVIYNELKLQYKKCSVNTIQDFLKVIMMQNAYNPVIKLIESSKWDCTDRLPELFRIMQIDDSDRLSKTLIYKWLWQNLSMARNERGEYGADGLLVLKGDQSVGKTTFARKAALKDEFFGEGLLLDIRQTDTVIRAVSCWIGELGEIESTFKSDINALKAFITLPRDNYRVPYGRTAEKLPRRTSFIGTCNSDEYLIDETGNRRYWTVPINERMDLKALEKFDMLQLYLQIDERDARKNIQGYRLTAEEKEQLDARNIKHEKPLKGEHEIKDILYKAENDNISFVFEEMTVTEFKNMYRALNNYSATQLSKVLNKFGILTENKRKYGKVQRLATLPRPKNRLDPADFKNQL